MKNILKKNAVELTEEEILEKEEKASLRKFKARAILADAGKIIGGAVVGAFGVLGYQHIKAKKESAEYIAEMEENMEEVA